MGWRDFQFTHLGDKEDNADKEQAQHNTLSTSSALSPKAISKSTTSNWQPITESQCKKLLQKYPDEKELWNRFWIFMGKQDSLGCTYEYMHDSYNNLEKVWNEKDVYAISGGTNQ